MSEEKSQQKEYEIKTGEISTIVHPTPSIHIRLFIDPAEASTDDDKYKLFASNGDYSKTLTVKGDQTEGDKFIDLIFDGIKTKWNYTLEIDPGSEGQPYKVFEDVPFKDLIEFYSLLDEGDELEEIEEEEEEDEGSEEELEDAWEEDESWGGDPDEIEDEDEIFDDEAAVTVPSFLNAARKPGILPMLQLGGSWSSLTTVSPRRDVTVTGVISALN